MAGQIITNEVNFPGKAVELKAYVAQPPGSGPFPAVIVVQEWWGLNEHIRDIARRLANEGYFTVAPDLYSRQGHQIAADPNAAGRLMQGLRKEDGIEDLLSTIDWINRQKAANRAKIGVVGFCMGGSYAILLPCSTKDIKAAAPFYGEVPSDDKLENLACPIFYAYGENDGWIARRDVRPALGRAQEVPQAWRGEDLRRMLARILQRHAQGRVRAQGGQRCLGARAQAVRR